MTSLKLASTGHQIWDYHQHGNNWQVSRLQRVTLFCCLTKDCKDRHCATPSQLHKSPLSCMLMLKMRSVLHQSFSKMVVLAKQMQWNTHLILLSTPLILWNNHLNPQGHGI